MPNRSAALWYPFYLILSLLVVAPVIASSALRSAFVGSASSSAELAVPADSLPIGDDPDLPAFLRGMVDKREYLMQRAAHIGRLRGLPHSLPGNPRADAIVEMERQIRAMGQRNAYKLESTTAVSWTELGPAPIPNGQTTPANPVSGRVTSIAVHPTNPNIVYVGTAQGGLYRTLDGGATWTQLFDNAQSLAIGAVTIDPIHPSIVFVGTGEPNLSLDSYFGVGLYIIRNADTAPVLSGPFETGTNTGGHAFLNTSISSIVVSPSNDSVIFVGNTFGSGGVSGSSAASAPIGLYFANNVLSGSPTFVRVTSLPGGGVAGITDISMRPGAPDTLVIGSEDFGASTSGIYRSTNATAGLSSAWTKVMTLASQNVRFAANKVGSTVTIVAGLEQSSGQLVKSADGGATWSAALSAVNGFCDGQCWYDIAPAIDPGNANIIYLGGSADGTSSFMVKKSINGGTTFSGAETGLHADVHAIAVAPSNGSILYTGNDGGIFKSTNSGSSWISLNTTGFNATQFESIALHPLDSHFSIGGTQDNGTNWYHPSAFWTRADFGDGGFSAIDQNATDTVNVTMYHTYYNATNNLLGFARVTTTASATDNGWAFLGCGGSSNGINCADAVLFYAPLALGPGNPNTLYYGSDHLYRSANRGTAMSAVSQVPIVSGRRISAIGISPQNDNVRIVGLDNGAVYATSTGSTTLSSITGPIPAQYVARAVIDPNISTTAYITLSGFGLAAGAHIWKTVNLSAVTPTWIASGTGIPDVPVNGFVIDPANSSHLFAGTDIGVYVSTDAGSTWNPLGTGLPHVAVFDMAIQPVSRALRIATHGRGMWEISIDAALPIQLSAFNGAALGARTVRLEWTTLSETHNYGFEVQRRQDSTALYETVRNGFLPGHGTTNEPQTYHFTDSPPEPGAYWYRLKQIDLDGSISYSEPMNIATGNGGEIPFTYELDQNYPNPFNPSTTIGYAVPAAGYVTLKVYDVLGRTVATLVDETKPAGTYTASLQASGLSSGVYFYELRAGNFVRTKRMLLVK